MSQTKIHIGSLSYSSSSEDIREYFSKFGPVKEVNLITHRDTGDSRGFAFVEFESEEAANQALESDGQEFMGRKIRVSIANDRSDTRRNDRNDRRNHDRRNHDHRRENKNHNRW